MQITISGIHMDTGEALRAHAEERLQGLEKYFDQVTEIMVNFVQESHHQHLHGAELTMYASGIMLRAEGAGIDWHAALDDAVGKLERQVERYKGRLMKHRERRKKFAEQMKLNGTAATDGMVFETAMVDSTRLDGVDGDGAALDRADKAFLDSFAPAVIRKDVSRVSPMTVDEAIMQMDLLHRPAFLFLNVDSNQLNMVFREGEQTIRWVAPKQVG